MTISNFKDFILSELKSFGLGMLFISACALFVGAVIGILMYMETHIVAGFVFAFLLASWFFGRALRD